VGPGNHILDTGLDHSTERGTLGDMYLPFLGQWMCPFFAPDRQNQQHMQLLITLQNEYSFSLCALI